MPDEPPTLPSGEGDPENTELVGPGRVGGTLLTCSKCRELHRVVPGQPAPSSCSRCGARLDLLAGLAARTAPPRTDSAAGGASSSTTVPAGIPFGRYRLLSELGQGGMGVVWRAWDCELRRAVALKRLRPEAGAAAAERFLREARAAARLRHPNVVTVLDVGVENGERYYTSELVEGRALSDLVGEPMPPREAARIALAIARGLAHAHEQGIVHRDVKPGNVLLDAEGHVRLTDFGLAREIEKGGDPTLTRTGMFLGTPAYASPEQLLGRPAGPESDQFSLGILLYELLAGVRPFGGGMAAVIGRAVLQDDPAPLRGGVHRVPRDLETICLKALEKDAARRYASVAELAEDLARFLAREEIAARPAGPLGRLWRRAARRRSSLGVVAALAVAAVGFVLWNGARTDPARDRAASLADSGASLEREGDLAGARDAYRSALELDPTLLSAREGLDRVEGLLARVRASREQAERLVESARLALEEATRTLYRQGAVYEDFADPARRARELLERAKAGAPGDAVVRYLLGRAWEIEGWEDRAEEEWRRAAALDPELGPARLALGHLLLRRVHWTTAEAASIESDLLARRAKELAGEGASEIRAALEGPHAVDDLHQRRLAWAILAWANSDVEGALRRAREGIEAMGRREGVEEYHWIEGLASRGPEQIAAYDRALEIRPTHAHALVGRAWARQRAGELEGALSDYDAAIRIHPRFPDALLNRGVVRHALGDLQGALADYDQALLVQPEFALALMNRARLRHTLGDPAGMLADCDRLLGVFPDVAVARVQRGDALLQIGDLDGAVAEYGEAIRVDPARVEAYLRRALVRLHRQELTGAIADCDEALSRNPDSVEAHLWRGEALRLGGDVAGARVELDLAVRLDPSNPHPLLARGALRMDAGELAGAVEDLRRAVELSEPGSAMRAEAERVLAEALRGGD